MKLTNILLAGVLVLLLGVVAIATSQQITVNVPPTQVLGQAGYNELGQSGLTQGTVDIGIEKANGASASTTAYQIFSANQGRMYAEIEVESTGAGVVELWFGTTTSSGGATSTYASSTIIYGKGKVLSTSTSPVYVIGPDNLWQGEVWAIATGTTSTVRTIQR